MHKLFYKNKTPYLAVPTNLSIVNLFKVLNFIPSFTLIRKLHKIYVFFTVILSRCLGVNFKKKNQPNFFLELSNIINENSRLSNYQYLIVWSLVDNRQRCYVYFYDKTLTLVYFAKFTKKTADFALIKNEYNCLLNFKAKEENIIFNCPTAVHLDENKDYYFLVVEALASNFKLFHPEYNEMPEKIFKYLNHNIIRKDLSYCFDQNWWKSFFKKKRNTFQLYKYIVSQESESKVQLSFIHGDLGSENTLINENKEFFIIDWERSSQVGPYYTDRVAFWLGKNHRKIKDNQDILQNFHDFFHDVNQLELYLALAYLVQVDFDLAILISNNFFYNENTL